MSNLKRWLNSTLHIILSDDRNIYGEFICTDRDVNIILNNAVEQNEYGQQRMLRQVVVPGRHIKQIRLHKTLE